MKLKTNKLVPTLALRRPCLIQGRFLYNQYMASNSKMNDKKRLEFAKQVEYMYEAANPNWRKLLTFAFLKGVATGFGLFLGGTILVALLLWILSGLGQLPFLNHLTKSVERTFEQGHE